MLICNLFDFLYEYVNSKQLFIGILSYCSVFHVFSTLDMVKLFKEKWKLSSTCRKKKSSDPFFEAFFLFTQLYCWRIISSFPNVKSIVKFLSWIWPHYLESVQNWKFCNMFPILDWHRFENCAIWASPKKSAWHRSLGLSLE